MRGILILDGPDAVGKTTLAHRIIAKIPGAEYVHLGKPNKGQAWNDHATALFQAIETMRRGKLAVMDRHFLSEAVYGSVYRDGSEYPYAARHVDRLLHRFGAMRIVCAPPVDYVVASHKKMSQEREELYQDKMYEVAKRYLEIWEGVDYVKDPETYSKKGYIEQLAYSGGVADRIGWYHYDVTTHGTDMDKYIDFLKSEMNDLAAMYTPFHHEVRDSDNITGWARRQSVLLVGDQPSSMGSKYPFTSNSGSSEYLAKVLNALDADESKICMVNINAVGGPQLVRAAKIACGRVVALGKNAERTMEKERIYYDDAVRHPQHARRFTTHDTSYQNELRQALNGYAGVRKAG